MVCELTPQEVRRKELGRMTMLEGTHLWKRQKEEKRKNEINEKREVRNLLQNYWPWGRPGGGAPNSRNVGLRNVYLEEIYPHEEMLKAKRQVGTFQFGRPGGGAPHVTNSGQKQIRFREDPALRFQWGEDLRRTVDNTLRYQAKREDQQQYKQQLDTLVEEKKKVRDRVLKKNLENERKLILRTPPWGRPGPGGKIWRQPKNLGVNFLKSMGWTTDATIQRIQNEDCQVKHNNDIKKHEHKHHQHEHHHGHRRHHIVEPEFHKNLLSNGIELVPLIVRRRPPAVKVPLGTTDVTRGDAMPRRIIVAEPKYFHDLTQQVHHKYERMKDARLEDVKGCQEHFKTWGSLWGRPGHGAPRSATQKGHLMSMLYPQMQPMPVH